MIKGTEENPDSTVTAEVGFAFWFWWVLVWWFFWWGWVGVWFWGFWFFFLGGGGEICEYTIFKRQVCVLEIDYSTFTPATDMYLRYEVTAF